MDESRVFMLNGTDVQKIVTRLEGFFRTEKGIQTASAVRILRLNRQLRSRQSQPKEINPIQQRQPVARIQQALRPEITAICFCG